MTPFDLFLTELAKAVAIIAVPVIVKFAVQALLALARKAHIDADAIDKESLEIEAMKSLAKGISDWTSLIETKGWDSPELKDAVLGSATEYFRERFKDRVAQIEKATGSADNLTLKVAETLSARYGKALKEASESPATPPAPLPFQPTEPKP